jgi:NAD(P)H-quinone oxidoreductase subunit 5
MLKLFAAIPWIVPGIYLLGASLALIRQIDGWRVLAVATRSSLGSSVAVMGAAVWVAPETAGMSQLTAALLFTALIAFLGWIIGDYSRRYLQGEPRQRGFIIAFLCALASVTTVVVSTNLATVILGWTASSAALHHLLTFYSDRPAAVLVAHKKFLASRLAEICLISAAILLYHTWGTLDLPVLAAQAAAAPKLPASAAAAVVLIALAVLIKSAQLPLHGWLIQVMEAPTPVSALMHAGIVNLGGYILIRWSPLIAASITAQALLVLVGSMTAALAGLVMMTRVTIKVRLAWSTCSQMGFMMMECGLGLYELAFLHLLAHALYKAHAFLTAGDVVRSTLARNLLTRAEPNQARAPVVSWMLALAVAWGIIIGSVSLWNQAFEPPWVATAILACGLATLLWPAPPKRFLSATGVLALIVGTQMYLAWHALASRLMAFAPHGTSVPLAIWALAVLLALYLAQGILSSHAYAPVAAGLYRWVYSGLYLDEHFTRLTFRLWPGRAPYGSSR